MPINLRQIEVFRAVMTTQSIRGASELLFVSQPAVSRLLSHTESRIGFMLFERIKGRLYATPEAKRLFGEIERMYQGVQRVNELANELAENREGIINIVSSPSIGQMMIPQAIAAFRRQHPQVKLTFQYLGYGPLKERLLNHQADFGITVLPVEHPNLEVTPLSQGELVCICPPDHPLARLPLLTLAEMRSFPLISYERTSPFGIIVQGMYDAADEVLRSAIEVGSPQNACALVQAGAGIALVDEFSVRNWPANQLVVRPVQNAPAMQANLVHPRFDPLSTLSQRFVAMLRQLMQSQGFDTCREATCTAGARPASTLAPRAAAPVFA